MMAIAMTKCRQGGCRSSSTSAHYLRSYDRFMEADREKLRVHVKLGCPDGYSVDMDEVKGHFPYVGSEQINVELVRGGLTHPTGSLANGGGAAEDIVVVNAAVSVTYQSL